MFRTFKATNHRPLIANYMSMDFPKKNSEMILVMYKTVGRDQRFISHFQGVE